MRKITALAVAVVITAVAGCGSSSSRGTNGNDADATPPASSTSSSTTVTFPLPYTTTMEAKDDNGFRWTTTLRRGSLMPARNLAGSQFNQTILGSTCNVSAETDMVQPFSISVTNQTDGNSFNAEPGRIGAELGYEIGMNTSADLTYQAEMTLGDGGTQCSNLTDPPLSVVNSAPQGEGQGFTFSGWIIFGGIFSPRYPNGNQDLFQQAVLTFKPHGSGVDSSEDGWGSIEGSSVGPTDNKGVRLSLDPLNLTGCLMQKVCRPVSF